MKKGFTLIELLAVIVILAIIALIATPIILGIINDARKESNERSAELYASAVRNAIASYQLTHPNAPETFADLDIQYDGEVECAKEELYADGSFYIAECIVNGDEVNYTYGTQQVAQVYKPQYYYFGLDWDGYVGETEAPANPSSVPPTGEIRYLGYDVTNGVVTTAYSCFVRNNTEYCLKGTTDGSLYETNVEIIKDAYSDVLDDLDGCYFDSVSSECNDGITSSYADSDGYVAASGLFVDCGVNGDGSFGCYEA